MTRPDQSLRKRESNPGFVALEANALTTRPTRQSRERGREREREGEREREREGGGGGKGGKEGERERELHLAMINTHKAFSVTQPDDK